MSCKQVLLRVGVGERARLWVYKISNSLFLSPLHAPAIPQESLQSKGASEGPNSVSALTKIAGKFTTQLNWYEFYLKTYQAYSSNLVSHWMMEMCYLVLCSKHVTTRHAHNSRISFMKMCHCLTEKAAKYNYFLFWTEWNPYARQSRRVLKFLIVMIKHVSKGCRTLEESAQQNSSRNS